MEQYYLASLERVFGNMRSFTKEENDYFWNNVYDKCTILTDKTILEE